MTYTRRVFDTGDRLTIGHADELGADPHAGAWVVVCETHGTRTQVDTQHTARTHRGTDFCGPCRQKIADEAEALFDRSLWPKITLYRPDTFRPCGSNEWCEICGHAFKRDQARRYIEVTLQDRLIPNRLPVEKRRALFRSGESLGGCPVHVNCAKRIPAGYVS